MPTHRTHVHHWIVESKVDPRSGAYNAQCRRRQCRALTTFPRISIPVGHGLGVTDAKNCDEAHKAQLITGAVRQPGIRRPLAAEWFSG